jgi:hypothetical protein
MQRTTQRISFTTSHRALAMKSTRPVFGYDMTSIERYRAAWDELPFWQMNMTRKEQHAWLWKSRFELGLRDPMRLTKLRSIGVTFMKLGGVLPLYLLWSIMEYVIYRDWPYNYRRENARAYAQRWGGDVWFADGKFAKPVFHINPPALTMTAEEL